MRVFEGRFGKLVLSELSANEHVQSGADPAVLMPRQGEELIFLNPGEIPTNLRSSLVDTDGDSIITFRDLNASANARPGIAYAMRAA